VSEQSRGEQGPKPDVMPVDVQAWRRQIGLSNFINAHYVQRDVADCVGEGNVLVIGPGQGLEPLILSWRGHRVTTFDIDARFAPDVIGSAHDLHMFKDAQFDVVVASHVLEHLPPAYLDAAIAEIARVGKHAVIYLPYHGRFFSLRFQAAVRGCDRSWIINLFNPWKRPDPLRPVYMQGQHFWEIGVRGYSRRAIRQKLARHFEVLKEYRNRDWLPSYNFVLRSRKA
jgi:hypothetical protein